MANPWKTGWERRRVEVEKMKAGVKFLEKQAELMDKQSELEDFNLQKVQLEHQARQEALSTLQDLSLPSSAPQGGIEGPPQTVEPGMPLSQILADPEGQLAALRSGLVSSKDIGMQEQRGLVRDLTGIGPSGGMKGVQQGTPQVQKGGLPLGIDPLSAITGDPSKLKRHPLDEPLSPTEQQKYVPDEQGNYPQTQREAQNYQLLAPGEARAINTQEAGKITSTLKAKEYATQAIGLLKNPDGTLDKSALMQMSLGDYAIGKGREINQLLGPAVTAKVLIDSGVTAREDEKQAVIKQYIPSLKDLTQPGLAERKLKRLQDFFDGALDLSTLPPSLAKRIRAKGFKGEKEKAKIKSQGGGNRFVYDPATRQVVPR